MAKIKIDPQDGRFVLMLNDLAACYRKLVDIAAPEAHVRDRYISMMLSAESDLDRAVEAAMRRAS